MGNWTESQKETAQRFRAWAREKAEKSNSEIAELLDCSPAVVSQMLKGSYSGDVDKYVRRMGQILKRQRKRSVAPVEPSFVKNTTAKKVIEGLWNAHTEKTLVFVVGPTGVGKTRAAKHYCNRDAAARYLATGEGCRPRALVGALADLLDVETSGRGTWGLRRDISRSLRGSDQLLVLDEVDYLPEKTHQVIRQIHDEAGCGVVLVGTPACLRRLRESKSDTKAQIMGRVARVVELGPCSDRDLREIAGQWDLDQETVDALVNSSEGQARRLTQILRAAQRRSELEDLDEEKVREAGQELMAPVSL